MKRPTVVDALDLVATWLARLGKKKHDGRAGFYETFFDASHIQKQMGDVRYIWRYRIVHRLFDERFSGRDARVADIGTGIGISLLYFPETADFIGVEYSANSLNLAKRIHPERSSVFLQGGFPNLPVASSTVDFCLCLEVVEHIVDDRQAI
jgi:ubiquinone/menaquinone biosynthesis C-methylase UbiE